jgi:hypothetical protein
LLDYVGRAFGGVSGVIEEFLFGAKGRGLRAFACRGCGTQRERREERVRELA